MGLLDFLNKTGIHKAFRIGHAAGKVLRKKLEDQLDKSEAKMAQTPFLAKVVEDELSRNLEQFRKFRQTPKAIGFIAVDFFSFRELEKMPSAFKLSQEQADTLEEALSFLRQCNSELDKIEVRKDGFVKGNLQLSLLDSGENILQKALQTIAKIT